jgi:hypothetical protein
MQVGRRSARGSSRETARRGDEILAVDTFPFGPRGSVPVPLAGGLCFGADAREPANESP